MVRRTALGDGGKVLPARRSDAVASAALVGLSTRAGQASTLLEALVCNKHQILSEMTT